MPLYPGIFRRFGFDAPQKWPYGALGDLHVLNGQVVQLFANTTYDYRSITVDAGGYLAIQPQQPGGWTIVGCHGPCVINGSILGRTAYGNGSTLVWNATDPNGYFMTYTQTQAPGGSGGGTSFYPGIGEAFGNGQGGSGGNPPGSHAPSGISLAIAGTGGDGGGGGGLADTYYGNVFIDGLGETGAGGTTGAGGGGGGRSGHGYGFYLFVRGNLSGSGTIDMSGGVGGQGGPGGAGYQSSIAGGGGGGGGAGGSGGAIIIRHIGSYGNTLTLLANGAGGGAGGGGGAGYPGDGFSCNEFGCSYVNSPTAAGAAGAGGGTGAGGYVTVLGS